MPQPLELLAAFDPLAVAAADGGERRAFRYLLLDVFTGEPLQGNQLAVFPDARDLPPALMQPLARELKLSESVFVLPGAEGADVSIRIFTPQAELPFAGHPVLGTAIVLGEALGRDQVALQTGIGLVQVSLARPPGGGATFGWMGQPTPSWRPYERAEQLLGALRVERSGLPIEVYENGPSHVFVELDSERAVADLSPDLGALGELGALGASCFAGSGGSWKTRMFAPSLGVPEDPATGSAAGPLAVHLCRHRRIAFGSEIEIRQGFEIDRPSLLRARVAGSEQQIERVEVGGRAVTVARGEFRLDR